MPDGDAMAADNHVRSAQAARIRAKVGRAALALDEACEEVAEREVSGVCANSRTWVCFDDLCELSYHLVHVT